MKKIFHTFIFICLFFLTIVYSFPCPPECICKPTDINDVDFTRMSYLIDCTNISLNNDKLIYEAEQWSINEDKIINDGDDDSDNDYIIAIDLSKSLSLKKFTNQTIRLTNFSFSLQSLSLTNQGKNFMLNLNSFYSSLYQDLKVLNLSSCCKQIPKDCDEIFRPLNKLQVLDLSGSDMYKTCLDTPDTISSSLRDLVLRNNVYNTNTFSRSSRLFDGVQQIPGKLDLQNSRFQINKQVTGNCIFDVFQKITTLDLSYMQFDTNPNNTEIYLKHLLNCKMHSEDVRNGEGLLNLYLRGLKLQYLPEWFTDDRFPSLALLDLSDNNFYSIDISTYSRLKYISLAYNPIQLRNVTWRRETVYESINLRSTIREQKFDLSRSLKVLFKLTRNIDYSENEGKIVSNITTIPIEVDFSASRLSLNISRTNIHSFQVNYDDLRRLDISWNLLNELNLNEQIKLEYLDCSNQYLGKLILNEQLSELNELKCSNNSLTTIGNFSLLKNEQLKSIDLSSNRITSLKILFLNLNSRFLHTINLQSNLIEIIQSNIFHQKLISLYKINLSWNKIHTIEQNAFQSPNLQILDLTGNPLKNLDANSILTKSLRLLYVFNNTQQSADRCEQLNTNYKLLSTTFKENGTSIQTEYRTCVTSNRIQTKTALIIKTGKRIFGAYSLYLIVGASCVGIFLIGIYYYGKNRLPNLLPFRRYKKLDRAMLVENEAEMDQREDDEIVMSLDEPPYNKLTQSITNV